MLAALATVPAALFGGLAATGSAPAQEDGAKRSGRPNFVVITTDDQTVASLTRRYMPKTIRLLVHRGTNFRNYVVTTPLCCPSRASMLTGQYAHNHRVLSNNVAHTGLRQPRSVLPEWLRRAGYRTGHVGKFVNNVYKDLARRPTAPSPGFDDWYTMISKGRYFNYVWSHNGRPVHHGEEPNDYLTRRINRTAAKLIRRYSARPEPFYLQVDQFAPHASHEESSARCAEAAKPDPRDQHLFRHEPLPHPPSFNEPDISDKRRFIRNMKRLRGADLRSTKRAFRCRMASLRAVDRGNRMIWRALKGSGEARDTIVIFTSDNGFFTGEHRLGGGKLLPYVEASRVPFVIKAPRRFTDGDPVRTVHDLAANIDIAPTLLRLARGRPCRRGSCRTLDGLSLVPLLKGRQWADQREVVIEYGSGDPRDRVRGTCEYSGVLSADATYVRYNQAGRCGLPQDERELYDLGADPFELENRNGDDAYEALRLLLHNRLTELRDCAGIQGRDEPRPHSSGFCD